DDLVTGVQTCALPIFAERVRAAVVERVLDRRAVVGVRVREGDPGDRVGAVVANEPPVVREKLRPPADRDGVVEAVARQAGQTAQIGRASCRAGGEVEW